MIILDFFSLSPIVPGRILGQSGILKENWFNN